MMYDKAQFPALAAAMLELADRDTDHARCENSVGYSGADTEIMNSFCDQLRSRGRLSEKQLTLALKKIKKYSKQWGGLIVLDQPVTFARMQAEFDALENTPVQAAQPKSEWVGTVDFAPSYVYNGKQTFVMWFKYNDDLYQTLKNSHKALVKKEEKGWRWYVHASHAEWVALLTEQFKLTPTETAKTELAHFTEVRKLMAERMQDWG